jgi:hypothetical protein
MRRNALGAVALAALAASGCQVLDLPRNSLLGPFGFVDGAFGMYAFTYDHGRACQLYRFPIDLVEVNTVEAMADLGFGQIRRSVSGGVVTYVAKTLDGHLATITLRPRNANAELTVKIGFWGDEPLSVALIERVALRFGSAPPSLVPLDPPPLGGPRPIGPSLARPVGVVAVPALPVAP